MSLRPLKIGLAFLGHFSSKNDLPGHQSLIFKLTRYIDPFIVREQIK